MPPRFSKRAGGGHKASEGVTGFRSGLEKVIADHLGSKGVAFFYEKVKVRYVIPARVATYTPDWWITSNGIIIESKGIFEVEDRQKHLLIKHQHPDLDIRFVFSSSSAKLYKGSPTTYAKWCQTHGFMFCNKLPLDEWLFAAPNPKAIKAIETATDEPDLHKWAMLRLSALAGTPRGAHA